MKSGVPSIFYIMFIMAISSTLWAWSQDYYNHPLFYPIALITFIIFCVFMWHANKDLDKSIADELARAEQLWDEKENK